MKLLKLFVGFAACAALPAVAADVYTLDPNHTFPSFEVNHAGFSTMRGRFNKTQGKVTLDMPAKSGSIEVSIDTASVDTGHAKRDADLRGEDFFNVAKYPAMTYKSTALKFDGDKVVSVTGELTLLGVTKPVTLTVANFRCGPNPFTKKPMCGADSTASIKRSEFGMKGGLPGVGDDIKIAIEVEAKQD
jgi:polyisoprenoid-binding protein YceI